jgi:Flp pilus assembly protein TadG
MGQQNIITYSPLKSLKSALWRFARREDGVIMAETVIILPMLLWSFLAMFVYWDSFRALNTAQKASYTISDMISREMVPVNDAYVTGMRNVMQYQLDVGQVPRIRVTSVRFSQANNRFEVHWSRTTATTVSALTTATLQGLSSRIPRMSDGDYVVIVETWVDYAPGFNVGLDSTVMQQFIVTRPRFVPRVCHSALGPSCA